MTKPFDQISDLIRPSDEQYVERAKAGDKEALKVLLQEAASAISRGEVLDDAVRTWLAEALLSLANGADPKKIFPLKRNRGKPPKFPLDQELEIVQFVRSCKAGRHKGINSDGKPGAYAEAAERYGISENTVEKLYKKHIKTIEGIERLHEARTLSQTKTTDT